MSRLCTWEHASLSALSSSPAVGMPLDVGGWSTGSEFQGVRGTEGKPCEAPPRRTAKRTGKRGRAYARGLAQVGCVWCSPALSFLSSRPWFMISSVRATRKSTWGGARRREGRPGLAEGLGAGDRPETAPAAKPGGGRLQTSSVGINGVRTCAHTDARMHAAHLVSLEEDAVPHARGRLGRQCRCEQHEEPVSGKQRRLAADVLAGGGERRGEGSVKRARHTHTNHTKVQCAGASTSRDTYTHRHLHTHAHRTQATRICRCLCSLGACFASGLSRTRPHPPHAELVAHTT